ncbi:hypothetical protein O0I10_009510 [Lichtheimia ornata]|uniref:Uncharacterized protein n=1 Tax=Lichtheimia ornata TaxID=688661 RepID=A0AAD7UW81_9FUNG|nr:uncharacterized protein O0I10_009510 [Lichtheimia ornata]KAJ8654789.1 hypothetical protein O0I10_009510 [Lichtheimia ornata]
MYSKKGTHLFLPYRTPPSQANWVHPFVLQLMNSHFILVKIRENVSFPWPDVEPYRPKYVTHDMPQDSCVTEDPISVPSEDSQDDSDNSDTEEVLDLTNF